jgi:hypothetical protein
VTDATTLNSFASGNCCGHLNGKLANLHDVVDKPHVFSLVGLKAATTTLGDGLDDDVALSPSSKN